MLAVFFARAAQGKKKEPKKEDHSSEGMATLEVYSEGNPRSPDYKCGIWVPVAQI